MNEQLKIGIDASRAFLKNRTGIEEYSYQIIKHLRQELKGKQVILYLRPGNKKNIDFEIPKNWQIKELIWGYFWTQFGLSVELLLNSVDILFVPAHTLPFIHPRRSYVTVHGLEYEFSPESYSWRSRLFHRFFIKKSCRWAENIVAVSRKTKDDLVKLYKVDSKKIEIIENGFDDGQENRGDNKTKEKLILSTRFLFFIGRLEERKNIVGIIEAFNVLRKKYGYLGKLLLGGGQGYGYNKIKETIEKSEYKQDIRELGFVSDSDKWVYLKKTDLFLFPSLFEGFGIPILEAQSVATPVITSDREPMRGVVGDKRVLVKPNNPEHIAKIVNKILQNESLRDSIVRHGLKNIQRFSWKNASKKIGKILTK